MSKLCIFHGGCDDGFGAAYAMWRALPETEFYGGAYQQEPPDCSGRDVYLVDFSYKRPVMGRIIEQAKTVTVLDHHKTAQAEIQPLIEAGAVLGEFDMDRSGAMMTWNWFHDGPAPRLIEYIQDRDLWRKELPQCNEVIMALRSYPQTFNVWHRLMTRDFSELLVDGKAIHRYYRTLVDQAKASAQYAMFKGKAQPVPVANVPHYLASEVAGELAESHDFAACFWHNKDGITWSLRSRDGFDCGAFAATFGGGGHVGAAGFRESKDNRVVALIGDWP